MSLPADVLDALCAFGKKGVELWGPRIREADEVRRARRVWLEHGAPDDVDIYTTDDEPGTLKIEPRRPPPRPDLERGDCIELEEMTNDAVPIPAGTRGTVTDVTDLTHLGPPRCWQVHVKWEIPRGLALLVPPDKYKKINP